MNSDERATMIKSLARVFASLALNCTAWAGSVELRRGQAN